MLAVLPRFVLTIVAALAINGAHAVGVGLPVAGARGHPDPQSWLDRAVAVGRCPVVPVNVSFAFRGRLDAMALRERIGITGDALEIEGTGNPDHIVILPGYRRGFVRVAFNGINLGHFGPVQSILVQGGDGDDAIMMGQDVRLPARLEGGVGDDCLQGGAGADVLLGGGGDDVLIAGTGRPALKTGTGSSRIVVPQRAGLLRISTSAQGELLSLLFSHNVELLPLLDELYALRALPSTAQDRRPRFGADAGTPGPVVISTADLTEAGSAQLLQESYAAGQAIVLINATADEAAPVRALLGHPNAAKRLASDEKAALIFFRKAPRPGSGAYDFSTGILSRSRLAGSIPGSRERMIELLSQIFSATAILPEASVPQGSSSASNDLMQLADSYTSHSITQNSAGSTIQIVNSVWAVRSFTNQADYYYVMQEFDLGVGANQYGPFPTIYGFNGTLIFDLDPGKTPTLIQPSPASTTCTETTLSGVTWNVGGSAGWSEKTGVNATLTGGVSVTNSTSVTCPQMTITNMSEPLGGHAQWGYQIPFTSSTPKPQLFPFVNHWVWEVPFTSYSELQKSSQPYITISGSVYQEDPSDGLYEAMSLMPPDPNWLMLNFNSVVPLPFGTTFALESPKVLSVSPTCVAPGQSFVINGAGFYPSLVTGVLISGTPLDPGNYTATSDTSIQVTAPSSLASSNNQPVVVQTEQGGQSNSSVMVKISTKC